MTAPHQRGRAVAGFIAVRARGSISMLMLALVSVGYLLVPVGAQAARVARQPMAPYQDLVALLTTHVARGRPALGSRRVASVSATRPITGQRTVLPILGQSIDSARQLWLRVRLPGRALGRATPPRTGWIQATYTQRSTTPWHIVVDLGSRQVIIYRDGRRLRTFRAIVGKPSTPTPQGLYFVEENVRLSSNAPGAPFALALSARSHVYTQFDGGPGQIAIHGVAHLGGQLGTAASHGCIRLANNAITWLAKRVGAGVPVTIH
jgi:hypothetical protein